MYATLHNHTTYSILDGFSLPQEYLERCKELGIKCFGITEHGNVYSHLYFSKLQKDYPDIKLLYGVEFYECLDINEKNKDNKYYHLLAFAKNERGRIALNHLVTQSNFEGFYYKPRVDINIMKPYGKDLIVCSACLASKLSREKDYNKCLEYVNEYKNVFPNFFLEMQSHKTADQSEYNQKILKLSHDTQTPFIITTDSHVARKEDLPYQAKFIQIARDKETMGEIYEGCYIQSEEEIHQTMDGQIGRDNVNLGLANTLVLADLCDDVKMPFQSPRLPKFDTPEQFSSELEYFNYLIKQGWYDRKLDQMSKDKQDIYRKRIEEEYQVITSMGFVGYFLIVWDYIKYCRDTGLVVGPGRGSGAGSLICYCLQITQLDPVEFGLIFERFLNPEKISYPDIDTDFTDRDAVIAHMCDKYGKGKVCQILNFSYITPNVAIRDAARILGIPYSESQRIADCFKYDTFQEGLDNHPELLNSIDKYGELFSMAQKFTGKIRNVSKHAGGVAVADTTLDEYLACKRGDNGETVIQCDKKMVEAIGLVKFDLLGVETLSIIQNTAKLAGINPDDLLPINGKLLNDKEAFDVICRLDVDGLFQVEGAGMVDLIKKLQPRNLMELSDIIALFRPDSMAFIDDYVNAKVNHKYPEYIHPDLKEILDPTYGSLIYQETMMNIVKKFSGKSFGRADIFRKVVSKKMKDKVKEEVDKLYGEIINNGYSEEVAKSITHMLETFGGYLFNSSHSYLYSTITLQTAYLKAHYPIEFYTSLLNSCIGNNAKINKYVNNIKKHNIPILPPSINHSQKDFSIVTNKQGQKEILFGLSAITAVGEKVADLILEERSKNGKFTGLDNLIERIPLSKDQVVALIKSGALPYRDKKVALEKYFEKVYPVKEVVEYKPVKSLPTQKELKEKWGIDCTIIKDRDERLKLYNEEAKKWYDSVKKKQLLEENKAKNNLEFADFQEKYMQNEEFWEFETLNIFLTQPNPFIEVYDYVRPIEIIEENSTGVIVGIISNIIKKTDKHNKQYAHMQIYSADGIKEVTSWASDYARNSYLYAKKNKVALLVEKKEGNKLFCCGCKPYLDWYNTDFQDLKAILKNKSIEAVYKNPRPLREKSKVIEEDNEENNN